MPVARLAPPTPAFKISRGSCRPFGATPREDGVNFALFSRHASAISLVLFRDGREEPVAEIPFDPALHKTGDVWHVFVHGLTADYLYGYRVHGPSTPKSGHRFNASVVLLDPYAAPSAAMPAGGRPTCRRARPKAV